MALDNFGELKNAFSKWMARDDLLTNLPNFVEMVEDKISRKSRLAPLRVVADLTIDGPIVTLPTDLKEIFSLSVDSKDIPSITIDKILENQEVAGKPCHYAQVSNSLYFAPPPDGTSTAKIVYYKKFKRLVADADTNEILQEASDIYHHGILSYAGLFTRDEFLIKTHMAMFAEALTSHLDKDQEEQYSGRLAINMDGVI